MTTVTHEQRLLIDGGLREASDGGVFEVINPATGEVAGVVANATHADMDEAIAAARRAFDDGVWANDRELRARSLRQLHSAIESEKEELRLELVEEVGTPITLTYAAQLDWPLSDGLLWPAEQIERFPWVRELPDAELMQPASRRWVVKEPIGVVAAVIPWNFPFEILINKLGPALAAGNTVVVKAAAQTPWNATRIGRLIAEKTDIPAGVVNVVTTDDHDVSQLLFTDPRVDMVSFTGSTATGELLLKLSAPTFKRTLMELGGKSAGIVLDDADLAVALPAAVAAVMHAGQGCALPTRLLVQRSVYAAAVPILQQIFASLPVGDPLDPQTVVGPIVSASQQERILDLIRTGVDEGARLLVGGTAVDRPGYFVAPTLFVDVDNSSTIAQQEIFGPVLAVTPFDDDEDAIRLANESPYGLSGNVFSGSPERALRIARGVRTGSFNVNGGLFYGADSPYGGYKASGLGRQGGVEGLETYLETKAIASTSALPFAETIR